MFCESSQAGISSGSIKFAELSQTTFMRQKTTDENGHSWRAGTATQALGLLLYSEDFVRPGWRLQVEGPEPCLPLLGS